MTGDTPLWFGATDADRGHTAAARLLRPEFRATVGPHTLGPLLARTLRGGLFALVEDGEIAHRRAVELSVGGGSNAPHMALPAILARAANSGLAQVYEAGEIEQLRWAVVERVHGWPLRILLGRRGLAFTGRRLAALGAELADALAALDTASGALRLAHGRLTVGHIVVDVTGRARLVGSPVAASEIGMVPDAIGLGTTLACAALAVAPDPRGLTPAALRTLSAALDRPENTARVHPVLRRLVQSLLLLSPEGFRPSMSVLRGEFARHMEGLPMGVPDPAWGRALSDAVRGLPPIHRPSVADAGAVINTLALHLPALAGTRALRPPPPMLLEVPPPDATTAPKLRLIGARPPETEAPIHGADLPVARVERGSRTRA